MFKKIVIALGLLAGSFLAAWGASNTLSGLNAGGPISGTDLFYDVQSVGTGGVRVTGTQFLNFVFGNVSGSCTASGSGVFSCGSNTGIAAGSNITTSGTASNITINVVSTPTFTSLTTTVASVPAWLTAGGVSMQTATVVGNLTAQFAQFSGFLTASGASLQTETVAGNLTGSTAKFTGNLTANIAQFPGFLTASGVSAQTLTLAGSIVVGVRSSASAAVTASASTDYFLCLDSTSATITVALPGSPATGLTYLIKDCTGQAATHGIILSPSTGNIDGASNSIMTRTFGSEAVTYTGSQWSIN